MRVSKKIGIFVGCGMALLVAHGIFDKKVTIDMPSGAINQLQTSKPLESMTQSHTEIANRKHHVTLETSFGKIIFETYDADAPKTVENFITLVHKNFYNNLTFHRVIKGFMIQGGDPKGDGTGGPGYTFADELNPAIESYKAGYQKGIVAMANAGPNTNGSQFFIMLEDTPLPKNYTIFGKVISGQDVVDRIGSIATGAKDRPREPIVMKHVSVSDVK